MTTRTPEQRSTQAQCTICETMLDGRPDEFLGAPSALSPSPAASGSHGLPRTTSRLSHKRAPPDGPDPGRQRVLDTFGSPRLVQRSPVTSNTLPSWNTICSDNTDHSGVDSQLSAGKVGGRLPPLPSDGCPPLARAGGPDPVPRCFGRLEHLLLCRFWQRNSPEETQGGPRPLREHKLPGDGHESQVACHTGKW